MVFLYPAFLLGFLSLAVPIIIHLVEMRRPQRLVFTNVAFLREVKQVTARSRRLKRWLILLSRLLLLACLVLAFAQPFVPTQAGGGAQALDDVRIYLDNSLSMQNTSRTAAVAMLDEAKSQIRQLATVFGPATHFRLLENSFSGGQTSTAALPMLDEVARVSNTPRRVSTAAAVTRLLSDAPAGSTPKVFVYSDFQRNTFDPRAFTAASTLGPDVYLLPLTAQTTRNVLVDTVLLKDEFVRAAESNRMVVRVANNGAERAAGVAVKVFLDNQQVSAYNLDLDPGERKTTEVDFRVSGDGVKRGRVEVADVPVTFDNTYYFTLRVAPRIRVLGVGPEIETPVKKAFAAEPAFAYTGAEERSLNYRTAAESDLIVLQELPAISAGVAENVRKFAQAGGSVVVIPAAKAERGSYTALFQGMGLGTVRWLTGGGSSQQFPLSAPDKLDAFFQGVFTQHDANLAMPKAAPALTWARSTVDVLRFRKGGAYLSGFQVGRGMVYVLASPLARDHTDFAAHALFVPVFYKLAQQSYRAAQQLAYPLGATIISLPVEARDSRKDVFKVVRDDSTSFIPEQQVRDGKLRFSTPPAMTQAGFYTLRRPGEASTVLAFNYDKHESNLAQYSVAELKQLTAGHPRLHVYEPGSGLDAAARFKAENFGEPLWKYCVVGALLFLLLEVLLVRFL